MLLLAIDTSGRQGGITLARGANDIEIIESTPIQGGTFSAELVPQIADVLEKHSYRATDLKALVAVTGPGSFTGLRVGLTAVKGLAEVLGIPIATVTSLEILLAAAGEPDSAMAVLDAGRGELYVATQTNGEREESLLTAAEAAAIASSRPLRVIAAEASVASKFPKSDLIQYCSTEVAARLGFDKVRARNTVDVLALDANYIRKSEAEYMQKLKKSGM
ncbi:MAG TPA: tRNA (adenosine(37)-N6)-threonylcarbamoyltransferase complex dimerization subunit type 1 TsaB [Terriglobales bacterium]|nr:tRNA (adenosine(37)-N6)-threonylcarbamoyltransferase complex dimerization subunit type 1 TsaB [Terriglobales bacterium]